MNKLYEGGFVQRVIENLPYKVVDKDVRPHIQMETKDGVVRHLSIEAMTATVFAKLKDMAEAHLGRKVQHAVFTLPQQYCSDAARYAVLHTGKDAGLHAVRILDEPIAAAVANGLHGKLRDEGNVLVLHVGGGTAEAIACSRSRMGSLSSWEGTWSLSLEEMTLIGGSWTTSSDWSGTSMDGTSAMTELLSGNSGRHVKTPRRH